MVGALVSYLGEEDSSLGGVTVGVGLFTLGVGLEIGKLPLPGLFPAPAVFQPV
jgi:hypothetical protein